MADTKTSNPTMSLVKSENTGLAAVEETTDELALSETDAVAHGLDAKSSAARRANFKATVKALSGDKTERVKCFRLAEMRAIIDNPSAHHPLEVAAAKTYIARNTK